MAAGGDEVAVQAGSYPSPPFERFLTDDCASGSSPSDDPDVRTNWVTFKCGDDATPRSVKHLTGDGAGLFTIKANAHVHIKGSCFFFWALRLGEPGDTTRTTQNVMIEGADIQGLESRGARNVRVKDVTSGPVIQCAYRNAGVPTAEKCDANGPWWEAAWADRPGNGDGGNTDLASIGQFPYVGRNTGGFITENFVLDGAWVHDQQSRNDFKWHGGCGIVQDVTANPPPPTGNVIFRRYVCERVQVQGVFLENSSGVTVENSIIGCSVEPWDNVGYNPERWAQCAPGQASFSIKDSTSGYMPANILVRYNSFYGPIRMGAYGSYSNVRVVGNIAKTWLSACEAGIFWDRNAWRDAGATCTDGSDINSVGDPWVQSSAGSVLSDQRLLDLRLSAGPKSFENWVTETTADYALGSDYGGAGRATPRSAGAHQR